MHLMPFFHKCSVCLFSTTGAGASILTESPRMLLPEPWKAGAFFWACCSRCHSSTVFPPCALIFSASFSSSITLALSPLPLLPPPTYLHAIERRREAEQKGHGEWAGRTWAGCRQVREHPSS